MLRTFFKFLFRFFIKLLILGIVLIGLFIGLVYIGGFGPVASENDLTEIKQAQASIVYSSDRKILGKYFVTNRTNVSYKQLPKHLVNALVATEDSRFYQHKGIDKMAMLRVLVKTILLGDRSSGGGSTLSQQLAKNLYKRKDFAFLSMPVNKTKEAILAYRLETIYTKQEILTLYLNTVPFGENVYGIESASQRFFSKSVKHLNLEQAAILVGMLKANTFYNPNKNPDHALQRRNIVLGQMLKENLISESQYQTSIQKPLSTHYKNLGIDNPNGYFLQQVKTKAVSILEKINKAQGTTWNIEKDGLIIETTLNHELQESALKARKKQLISLQKQMDSYWNHIKQKKEIQKIIKTEWQKSKVYLGFKKQGLTYNQIYKKAKIKHNVHVFDWENGNKNYSQLDSISHYLKMINAAIYGVNTQNGAVQIYVAGNNYKYLPYNLIKSERQVASTFKPIVYTAALENGAAPCDWISNKKVVYDDYDNWQPENYDHSEGGYYSMGGALAKSANIPTVATYVSVGHTKVQKTAHQLGLNKVLAQTPTTALGTNSFSLQNMVHTYVPFATRSYTVNPYYITAIKDTKGTTIYKHKTKKIKSTISSNSLQTMQYLLKNVVEKGTAIKLRTSYNTKGEWAGKTGTSQKYSDSWFIGFNKNIVIGSWVGCKYPSINLPSKIGGGSVAALPIVGSIIEKEYTNTSTNRMLSRGFDTFNETIVTNCDCEFFREENTVEKIIDIFTPETDKDTKKTKKKNFFKRLFGIFKKKK